MFKLLNKKKKDNKGFTLVELVIVIAILAILVGLLAPQYTKYVEKSRKSADVDNMDELIKAVQVYAVDKGTATGGNTAKTGITITLADSGVTCSDNDVQTAFNEYVPKWNKIKLKSKQWNTENKVIATLDITSDGGVTVKSITPDTFQTYGETGVSTSAAPSTGSNG